LILIEINLIGEEQNMPTVLTANDFGKSVTVQPGEMLVLRLPENRTTGYAWRLKTMPAHGIRLIDETVSASSTSIGGREEGFAGASSMHEFQLQASKPGTFVVLLRKIFGNEPEPDDREEQMQLVVQP
jgi:predicted secreted protein